jgi:hypothetical protein
MPRAPARRRTRSAPGHPPLDRPVFDESSRRLRGNDPIAALRPWRQAAGEAAVAVAAPAHASAQLPAYSRSRNRRHAAPVREAAGALPRRNPAWAAALSHLTSPGNRATGRVGAAVLKRRCGAVARGVAAASAGYLRGAAAVNCGRLCEIAAVQ